MDVALTTAVVYLAGTLVALAIGWLLPAFGQGLAGALSLGGLGGVIIGLLKDHITGAHHHMAGHDMAGMSMAPATDPSVMLTNVIWGGAGGGVFLILAYIIGRIFPNKGSL